MFTLGKDCKITRVKNAVVAGTTSQDSNRVDMTGFDSVIFLWLIGTLTDTGTLTASSKSNAADSTSNSTTEKTGTTLTGAASAYDNGILAVDLHKPTLRYAYSTLARGVANCVIDGCIAIQYNAAKGPLPITQGATIMDLVFGGPNA